MNAPAPSPRTYLLEVYIARTASEELPQAVARAHTSADQMSREGIPVRFVRAIFVPEDEICFFVYEARSADVVREATRRAGIGFERLVEAVQVIAARPSNR